jgi:anti-sigma factor RsiW
MDKELNRLLDSYTVAGADQALIDRINQQVQAQQVVIAVPARRYNAFYAAVFVVLAFSGFFMGNASKTAVTASSASYSKYISQTVLGPASINDFSL